LTPTTIISQEPKIHPLGTAEQPQKRPQIVLIDDDITIGKQVEAILKSYGYGLTIIQDPIAALSQMFHLQPDLILCDITMPQLEGDEICAMLRNSTIFRQIPIIMLTGKDAFIDRVKARMRGATDYLTKPFGEQELLLLLEKYLAWDHPQNLSQPALV
jgi:twitching motility two-component system response regulator PilG